MVTAVVLGFNGVGAFFFTILATAIANPDFDEPESDSPDALFTSQEVIKDVPLMLRALLIFWSALWMVALMVIRRRQSIERYMVFKPFKLEQDKASSKSSGVFSDEEEEEQNFRREVFEELKAV